MKKNDKKYRQGRNKDKQSINETVLIYVFTTILIMLFALILYNLSLPLFNIY